MQRHGPAAGASQARKPFSTTRVAEKVEGQMVYGSFNWNKAPADVVRRFPSSEGFGYELIQLHLRAVCDTMQERDSICVQAKDAHLYVASIGPVSSKKKKWYGIYW